MSDVFLRDVSENDLPVFFEQQTDPDACEMAAFPSRNRESFMEHWAKILKDSAVDRKTILLGDRIAGYVVCFERGGKVQVGYWIGKEFWGQGVATRGLDAFLGCVQERPLYAFVAKHNVGSLRVLQKCGFEIHGEGEVPHADGEPVIEEFVLRLE